MPMIGYHTTKEIDYSKVSLDLKLMNSSVEPLILNDVMAVPDLSNLCKSHCHLMDVFLKAERLHYYKH